MRRIVLCLGAVLSATAVGCVKKSWLGLVSGDENATYTVNYRERKAGDVLEALETFSRTATGDRSLVGSDRKEGEQVSYTEWVQAVDGDPPVPVKAKRAYTVARKRVGGTWTPAVYQNRTVLVEKGDAGFGVQIEGARHLTRFEATDIRHDFERGTYLSKDSLPGQPVHIGEPWSAGRKFLDRIGALITDSLPFRVNVLSGVGKLTKVYHKGDAQWGTVEITFGVVTSGGASTVAAAITMNTTAVIDIPIDGSSSDLTSRVRAVCESTVRFDHEAGRTMTSKYDLSAEYNLKTVGGR